MEQRWGRERLPIGSGALGAKLGTLGKNWKLGSLTLPKLGSDPRPQEDPPVCNESKSMKSRGKRSIEVKQCPFPEDLDLNRRKRNAHFSSSR